MTSPRSASLVVIVIIVEYQIRSRRRESSREGLLAFLDVQQNRNAIYFINMRDNTVIMHK